MSGQSIPADGHPDGQRKLDRSGVGRFRFTDERFEHPSRLRG
jgi:hypothetical protein